MMAQSAADGPGEFLVLTPETEKMDTGSEWLFTPHRRNLRVLLVDDSLAEARAILEELAGSSDLVTESILVASLDKALDRLRRDRFELILVDLQLPDASGVAVLQSLREAAPALPIIVLTPEGNAELGPQAVRLGASEFLGKDDLSGPALSRAVRYALERQESRRSESFLAEATDLLGSTVEMADLLNQLAVLCVGNLCDLCRADILRPDGSLERSCLAHPPGADAEECEPLRRVQIIDDPDITEMGLNRPVVQRLADERRWLADDASRAALEELGIEACLSLPLRHDDTLLAILRMFLVGREFGEEHVRLAERFGAIVAASVHRAQLFAEAREALRTRDRVLSIVAHDLRNPLGTITMSTDLLLDDSETEARVQNQLYLIRRSAERMNRLIDDLLDAARIEEGVLTLVPRYGAPKGLVADAVSSSSAIAAARDVGLIHRCNAEAPICVDHDRMMQVFSNVIGNAIKFTPPGGRITLAVEEVEDRIRFSITDGGPGIPPDELAHLFVPFWQGRKKMGSGVGLGLSIARGIVEAHDGTIWATSEEGGPATFHFEIPAAPERRRTKRPPGGTWQPADKPAPRRLF